MLTLPLVEVAGEPRAMGRAHGEALRAAIRDFVAERVRAGELFVRQRRRGDFLAAAAACLEQLAAWDPEGWDEHQGIAEAAGVDPVALYAAANLTDVRDVACFRPCASAEREGCTAVLVPATHSATGAPLAGQTWDLNPPDVAWGIALRRRPKRGPPTVSVTCAGCPNLIGINAWGLAFGTTNLKVHGVRPGIPYLSLLHRLSRCRDRGEAGAVLAAAPRAAAHSYWLADPAGVEDWECTALQARRRAGNAPLARTNHCLEPALAADEDEPPTASSRARLARAEQALSLAAAQPLGIGDLQRLFADRSAGGDSINRYPEDESGTATNACAIVEPARALLHACRGPADRGQWRALSAA
ncbi:MAG: C45 family peptidase [Planctomycetota bacterium]|nr:C45 family peptidase [Planctomycetota bacterium]